MNLNMFSIKKLTVFLFSLGLSCHVLADGLPPTVLQALKIAKIPAANVAVVVQQVDANMPLVQHNATQAMNPASVMKLVTTYAALDMLGPAYTWKTSAWVDKQAVNGRLEGNVYLKGSGDPRFAMEHLWALLRQLRVRGIQHIAGDVILDRTAFNVPAVDPGAFDSNPMRPYNVGPDGLLINFRAMSFTLVSDSPQPQILMETPSDNLVIDNKLTIGNGGCPGYWKDLINTRLISEPTGKRLEFTGVYSTRCGVKSLNLAPMSADAQADGLIRSLWKELGGTLGGSVKNGLLPAGTWMVGRHESSALADIVRDINKFSNNVMARQVFLALGNDSAPATVERSRQRVAEWLHLKGLRLDDLVLENGSGLSRKERISAASLNRMLLDAWSNPVMPEFISSMPIVGIDGTMKKRLGSSEATGRAHIKTGTLEGVKTAAGYALDAQGKRYTVIFFINHPRSALGSNAIDALLLWVAERRVGEKTVVLENE